MRQLFTSGVEGPLAFNLRISIQRRPMMDNVGHCSAADGPLAPSLFYAGLKKKKRSIQWRIGSYLKTWHSLGSQNAENGIIRVKKGQHSAVGPGPLGFS